MQACHIYLRLHWTLEPEQPSRYAGWLKGLLQSRGKFALLNNLTSASTIHLSTATSDMTFRNLSALHSRQIISTTKIIIIFTSARQRAGKTNACNGSQHLSNASKCNYKQKKSAAKHKKVNDYRRSPQQIVGIVRYVQPIIITEHNVGLWFSNWSAANQVLSVGGVKGAHHNQSERKTGNHDIYSIEYQNTSNCTVHSMRLHPTHRPDAVFHQTLASL